jgi:hypothetical protein
MAMIEIPNVAGHPTAINADAIIRIRPALDDEPEGSTLVDFGTGVLYTRKSLSEVRDIAAPYIRLCLLHSPVGKDLLLNAGAVVAIMPTNPVKHHPAAHSVAKFMSGIEQQLQETVADAMAKLNSAGQS